MRWSGSESHRSHVTKKYPRSAWAHSRPGVDLIDRPLTKPVSTTATAVA